MKRIILSALAVGAVLTGCGMTQDPCDSLRTPTAEQQKVAEDPRVEVERVLGGTDCVVVDNEWVNEADLEEDD